MSTASSHQYSYRHGNSSILLRGAVSLGSLQRPLIITHLGCIFFFSAILKDVDSRILKFVFKTTPLADDAICAVYWRRLWFLKRGEKSAYHRICGLPMPIHVHPKMIVGSEPLWGIFRPQTYDKPRLSGQDLETKQEINGVLFIKALVNTLGDHH